MADIAAQLLSDLKRDYGLTDEQAAGVVGNLMYESGGFQSLQEISPTVPGSKGGFGYAQWTGPRRTAFENWVGEKGLDPTSYDANYGFLKHELATNRYERNQFNKVRNADTAAEAARLISENFLRPGKPNLAARQNLASQALGYASSPVPPMDIPGETAVGTKLDVMRAAPTPAQQSMPLALQRRVTSPSGGNTALQEAVMRAATAKGNQVTPVMRPGPSASDRVRGNEANTREIATTIASIPSTQPSSASDMVRGRSGISTVATIPSVAPKPSVTDAARRAVLSMGGNQSYAGKDTAVASTFGRGTAVDPVVAKSPMVASPSSGFAGQDRAISPKLPNQQQVEAATGFRVPQSAQFQYDPTPQPERLVSMADYYPKTPATIPSVTPVQAAAVTPSVAPVMAAAQPVARQQPVVAQPIMRQPIRQPVQQQPVRIMVRAAPIVQQAQPVMNPANHNAAQLAALEQGRSYYTTSDGSVQPTRAMNGNVRYTYGD